MHIAAGLELNSTAAGLVKNFLNYVIHHDVCPEYRAQIDKARAICDFAPSELEDLGVLQCTMPGLFNHAASFLFCEGGVHMLTDSTGACPDAISKEQQEWIDLQLVTFRISVSYWFHDDKLSLLAGQEDPTQIKVVNKTTKSYEVVSMKRPQKSLAKRLEEGFASTAYAGKILPVGTVRLRPAILEHAFTGLPRPEDKDLIGEPTKTFYLEEDIIARLHPGMKLRMVVCELNIGLTFIEKCEDIRVSFDTVLPQSLMFGWKEPKPNERPAPSATEPGGEQEEVEDFRDD
jgi:hypothetical protein